MEYTFTNEELNAGKVFLINKNLDWTSFDVVKKVRNIIRSKIENKKIKVGHAGTLDPLATGLMIVCVGKETKNIEKYQQEPKEYLAELYLGKSTPSYDLETEVNKTYAIDHITKDFIEEKLINFEGEIMQTPPIFSAKWINGKRAYDYARKGKKIDLKPVKIKIYSIKIVDFKSPVLLLRILCSKGTYIRALARDIGLALNSGAYLQKLERIKIGNYLLENAIQISDFEKKLKISKTNN